MWKPFNNLGSTNYSRHYVWELTLISLLKTRMSTNQSLVTTRRPKQHNTNQIERFESFCNARWAALALRLANKSIMMPMGTRNKIRPLFGQAMLHVHCCSINYYSSTASSVVVQHHWIAWVEMSCSSENQTLTTVALQFDMLFPITQFYEWQQKNRVSCQCALPAYVSLIKVWILSTT